jgi:restriction endonuclease
VRFRFTVQPYQTAAVEAVADCFAGQPHRADPTANAPLRLSEVDLLANVHRVQDARGLPRSEGLVASAAGRLNLDVEMETGTGKTYVFIKTVFELHRRYGWGKFIVVVPGVAIREGVLRSLELTADHFAEAYGRRARFFAYRSRELHRLETFSADPGVNVMVINAQAFNATGADSRRIHEELDDFQSRRPIDVLAACRPVLVLDEPQRLEGRRTGQALAAFRPLAVLRYSATHRTEHNLVHRLDALDAYRQGLVKRISVRGITTEGETGPALRRLQIRESVRAHLEREKELAGRGIKTLSLFFIDEVRHYRDYTREDRRGLYLRMFEEEYRAAAGDDAVDVSSVHSGYFSVDRRTGRLVDPVIRRSTGTTDDLDAYHLILRDRERLLSPDEPVRFVFSHSALREGWDNPNVFVLCVLKQSDSTVSRRQEVGRGLRLAVDRHGERVPDPDVNQLTVVAGESYADFVGALQREASRLPGPGNVRHLPPIVDGRRAARRAPTATDAADRPTDRVEVDTDVLVARCVAALDAALADRAGLRYTVRTGTQRDGGFAAVGAVAGTWTAPVAPDARYDLLGVLARATALTRRTIAAILGGISPSTFALFARDPDRFLAGAAALISVECGRVALGEAGLELLDRRGEAGVVAPDPGRPG